MRLVVLASASSWYLRDLVRAAGADHQVTQAGFSELTSQVDGSGIQVHSGPLPLGDADAVLVRTMPPGSLEQVVFRMNALAELEASGTCVLNPARSMEVAIDKYLATARLQQAGFRVPVTVACQTVDETLAAFHALGGDVVVKPLFGSEGRGITRCQDEALMLRAAKMLAQLGAVIYLQPFIEHQGFDIRLLVIGPQVFAIRRRNALDWRTNVSRGAQAEPIELTAELAEMAQRAAQAVGAPLAGVDLLPAVDGTLYAIEVNAVPGWRAVARATGVDIARRVLEFVEHQLQETGAK